MFLNYEQEVDLYLNLSSKGEIPLKFSYIEQGAQNWNKYMEKSIGQADSTYKIEHKLLQTRYLEYFTKIYKGKTIDLLDIGCGEGTPALNLISKLLAQDIKVKYLPIDISKQLLQTASDKIRTNYPDIEIEEIEIDFEDVNLSKKTSLSEQVRLWCFFGNTLGNFSDPQRILRNFSMAMAEDDYLIIGNGIFNNVHKSQWINYYYDKGCEKLASFVPNIYGLDNKISTYEVEWNDQFKQIEMSLVLNQNTSINIAEKNINLKNGEKILIARSAKHRDSDLFQMYSQAGFRVDTFVTNQERTYSLSLLQTNRGR